MRPPARINPIHIYIYIYCELLIVLQDEVRQHEAASSIKSFWMSYRIRSGIFATLKARREAERAFAAQIEAVSTNDIYRYTDRSI